MDSLALEPSIIYKANNIEDIWLFDWEGDDKFIYPFYIFKGSQKFGMMVKMKYTK